MLFAASRVPCTSVADDVAEGFVSIVDGLSMLRRLTAQVRAHLGVKRKDWKLLLDTMELHGHSALFWACRSVPRRRDCNPERTVVTPQQVKRLVAALPAPAKSIALLLVLTGLRIGELLALRWKNVNLDAKVLQVTETV